MIQSVLVGRLFVPVRGNNLVRFRKEEKVVHYGTRTYSYRKLAYSEVGGRCCTCRLSRSNSYAVHDSRIRKLRGSWFKV